MRTIAPFPFPSSLSPSSRHPSCVLRGSSSCGPPRRPSFFPRLSFSAPRLSCRLQPCQGKLHASRDRVPSPSPSPSPLPSRVPAPSPSQPPFGAWICDGLCDGISDPCYASSWNCTCNASTSTSYDPYGDSCASSDGGVPRHHLHGRTTIIC